MFETMADGASLASRVLEQHHRGPLRTLRQRRADRVGNQPQGVGLGPGGARTGMNDDAEQAERVRSIEFVDERRG